MSGQRATITLDAGDVAILWDLIEHRLTISPTRNGYADHLRDIRNRLVEAIHGEPARLFDQDDSA